MFAGFQRSNLEKVPHFLVEKNQGTISKLSLERATMEGSSVMTSA